MIGIDQSNFRKQATVSVPLKFLALLSQADM